MAPPPDFAPSAVKLRNVLVGLDGSDLALQAMPTARVLAQRFAATLNTVTVAEGDEEIEQARAHASTALGVHPDDERVAVFAEGDPAEVIARRAEVLDPCVVCVVTHGRGRLTGALIGSVARSLLQRMTSPLVVLGPSADNPGWSPRPRNWPEPLSVPRIVACVDGSTASERILPAAAAWAIALDMTLTVVTVVADVPPPITPDPKPGPFGEHGDAATYLDQLVQPWRSETLAIDIEVVRDPLGVASGMRTYLDEHPAGLVALTTHARSGLQRAVLGATASEIVHSSVVPCLVLPVTA